MSTPKKRKYVDLVSPDSIADEELPTQPKKKFKPSSSPCVTITQFPHCMQSNQIPPLEKDDSTNENITDNNVSIIINQQVQSYHDQISSIPPQIHNNSMQKTQQNEPIFNQKLLDIIPEPAKTFPFELDEFQFDAIKSLETEQVNLLITAHTSAGKTVVAEYAIAKALLNNQRVIYTSPIKALSNQKYREFTEKFGHSNIGLITGDVTKRRNASVLVMTTEILRNMLYKGGSALREVAYVIFDEVHYMRDVERGVVWEESIILLNKKITLIFLSATLSNSDDFALWVTDLKQRECKIIGTEERPIVLEHYILPRGADALYLVSSSQTNTFLDGNFEYAITAKEQTKTYKQMDEARKRSKLKISELQLLLYMLYKNDWCPAIVFAFSKREVEGHALALNDSINFCSKQESEMIEDIFNNAIDSLSEKDKQLPAVKSLLPLLKKGIGVHHGGILPILKEVTEILFQEGMIRVLFATETFAMGVNMPAKCVVFSAIEKFDGQSTRFLTSSEYIQMSGRAGRRGIDERGIVIMMMNDGFSKEECRQLMCGKAGALTSSFRLTYNMLLNISKNIRTNVSKDESKNDDDDVDEVLMEDNDDFSYQTVIERSFYRFLMTQRIPQIEMRSKQLRDVVNEVEAASDFDDMKIYFDLYELRRKILDKAHGIMTCGYIMNKYLQYGRIVFVEVENENGDSQVWGWGIVLGYCQRHQPDSYFADILIPSQKIEGKKESLVQPAPVMDENIDLNKPIDFKSLAAACKNKYGLLVVRFNTNCIRKISSARLNKLLPHSIMKDNDYYDLYDKLMSVYKHFVNRMPELDIFTDMEILSLYRDANKISLKDDFEQRLPKLNERMIETKYFKSKFENKFDVKIEFEKEELILYKLYKQYKTSKTEYNKLRNRLSTYNVGEFAKELKCKCRVLKRLKYLNDENILTSKGIAASYLETNHEILITELMFDNFFNKLTAEEICAVVSVFVLDKPNKKDKSQDKNKKVNFPVPIIVHNCYEKILIKAREILLIKKECGLTKDFGLFDIASMGDEDDYISSFVPDLILPIFQWVNGEDFINVNKLTPLFEGALIRFIKRLRDLINNLTDAAKAIGNDVLSGKFNECIEKLQRGIVFAASLYVDDIEEEEEEDDEDDDEEDDDEEDDDEETVDNDENDHGDNNNNNNDNDEINENQSNDYDYDDEATESE